MNFLLLGAAVCVFTFASAWMTGLLLSRILGRKLNEPSAGTAFAVGVAPLALGIISVLILVVPAVLIYEPRDTREAAGVILLAGAAAGLLLMVRTAVRLARMVLASRRFVRQWAQHASPSDQSPRCPRCVWTRVILSLRWLDSPAPRSILTAAC